MTADNNIVDIGYTDEVEFLEYAYNQNYNERKRTGKLEQENNEPENLVGDSLE